MRFDNSRESDNVEDRRGGGGGRGLPMGGKGIGLGTIVLALVAMYFGVDPSIVLNQAVEAPAPSAAIRRLGLPEFTAMLAMLFATIAFSIDAMLPALATVFAAPLVLAQPPMGPPDGAPGMHEGRGPGRHWEQMHERMEQRFVQLEQALKLRPEQKPAWDAFAAARPQPAQSRASPTLRRADRPCGARSSQPTRRGCSTCGGQSSQRRCPRAPRLRLRRTRRAARFT